MTNRIRPRVALVTGGGSGIGRAVALGLARGGYLVVVAGRRRARLDATLSAASGSSGGIIPIPTNLARPDEIRQLFGRVRREFGRLDLLFNNAGQSTLPTPLEDLSLEQWQAVVDVNLTATFVCTQEAFKIMKAQEPRGGRIINNGSISAQSPRPLSVAYTATKHAITGLTKSTSLEGRTYDIACGQIDIGNAATDMTEGFVGGTPQADGTTRPEPRISLDHVVDAVLYMADLPLDANVQFMTLIATKMPLVGRG